jgi:hypothetical protein
MAASLWNAENEWKDVREEEMQPLSPHPVLK